MGDGNLDVSRRTNWLAAIIIIVIVIFVLIGSYFIYSIFSNPSKNNENSNMTDSISHLSFSERELINCLKNERNVECSLLLDRNLSESFCKKLNYEDKEVCLKRLKYNQSSVVIGVGVGIA